MDGSSAARVAGKLYKDVEIAGRKFRLSQPKRVGLHGEIEAFILSRKDDPLVLAVRACKMAPASQHAAIWEAAMRTASQARIVSKEEWRQFEASNWSTAFMLWKCLDQKHTEGPQADVPTVEAAMDLILEEADLAEVMANVAVVNQDVDLKNFAGRSEAPANSQPTDTPATTDGQPSTFTSPSDSSSTTDK